MFNALDWANTGSFPKKGETGWQLVRKTPVKNSTGKTWMEQQALLGTNEETPRMEVMAYMIIGHFLATGERLFERISVTCSDTLWSGPVDIGYYNADSEDNRTLEPYWDGNSGRYLHRHVRKDRDPDYDPESVIVSGHNWDDRSDRLGIASARKPERGVVWALGKLRGE